MLELAVLQGLLFSAIMSLTIDFIATPQTASISTMLQGFIFRAVIFGAGMYLLALYDKKRAKAA